ncbi:MAG: integrating conjugative element protein [Tatlockia sp.]|nr:integrating conjugative element protein [Tatlockia sp.]
MKRLSLLGSLLLIGSCYAYQFAEFKPEAITTESLKLEEKLDARLPAISRVTQGRVTARQIEFAEFSYPLFIVGGDDFSYRWLKEHAEQLEKIKAMGFVTNIKDENRLHALQQLTKMPLLPANVDDLMTLLKENHYPLIFYKDRLWQ